MTKKPSEILQSWIDQQLRTMQPGDRFPTDKELTKTFQISNSTVRRVVKNFTNKGLLSRIPGKGTFIPNPDAENNYTAEVPVSSAKIIVEKICQSIYNGDVKFGEALAPIKYMCYRFKVTGKTVIEAYKELQDMGYVTKVGKTFWVGKFKDLINLQQKKEVFLFNYQTYDFTRVFQNNLLAQVYQNMERELLSNGFVLRFENTDDFEQVTKKWSTEQRDPFGLIFCNLDEKRFKKILPAVRGYLDSMEERKPPVVLDWNIGFFKKEVKGTLLLSRGNILTSSARALVQFLIEHKYREVNLFLDEAKPVWNFSSPIHPLFRIIKELYLQGSNVKPQFFIKPKKTNAEYKTYLRKTQFPQIIDYVSSYEDKNSGIPYTRIAQGIKLVNDFTPMFTEPGKSAIWIFSTDFQAAKAYKWAKAQGIKIPGELAIMGLENNPKFFHLGLSYCGPDWEGIGYLLAHAIIRDFPVDKTTKGFLRTKAVVVEKLTT